MGKLYTVRFGNQWRDGFASLASALGWARENATGFYSVASYQGRQR